MFYVYCIGGPYYNVSFASLGHADAVADALNCHNDNEALYTVIRL